MGKPTGFVEYKREYLQSIPPETRVKNYKEFEESFTELKLWINIPEFACLNASIASCLICLIIGILIFFVFVNFL